MLTKRSNTYCLKYFLFPFRFMNKNEDKYIIQYVCSVGILYYYSFYFIVDINFFNRLIAFIHSAYTHKWIFFISNWFTISSITITFDSTEHDPDRCFLSWHKILSNPLTRHTLTIYFILTQWIFFWLKVATKC